MKHVGFLEYRHFRYLKWAWGLVALTAAFYIWHRLYVFQTPGKVGYGGTWPGYFFGTVAAMMVVWLAWLGIRKRRYNNSGSTQGWLSAHVYLGCAVVIVASLHSGFELGWNNHSATYLLMWVVVASGIYGVTVFSRVPSRLTTTMGDDTLSTMMLQLQDVDTQVQRLALTLPDQYNTLILNAATNTRLRGTGLQNLLGTVAKNCPTAHAVATIERLNHTVDAASGRAAREVYGEMVRRNGLVNRIRRAHRLTAKLRLWLMVHVPLSIGLLVAMVAHIVSVFVYW